MHRETREHQKVRGANYFGLATSCVICPFCGTRTRVYPWNLVGNGKKCPCGATHTSFNLSRKTITNET